MLTGPSTVGGHEAEAEETGHTEQCAGPPEISSSTVTK